VRVGDLRSRDELLLLEGHTGPVTSVLFSPDGHTLLSACPKGSIEVHVWLSGRGVVPFPTK
jgi:WD40 repeat protein